MSENKFRAWDKTLQKFWDADLYIDSEGTIYQWASNAAERWLEPTDNFELDWYTGYNDKNNREIYGGDKLKGKYGNIGEVKYSKSIAWFMEYNLINNPNINKSFPYDTANKTIQLWKLCQFPNSCEVIGNIHESRIMKGGEK